MRTDDRIEREEDRQIVISRVIDGPRHLVFRAWTEARHLEQWFGPWGFTTATRAFEFRPGGVWEFEMHGPDGTAYPNWIEWREMVPPERIVYRQGERADDPNAFETTVTFAERGARTEINLRTLFNSKAQRDYVAEHYHAVEGGRETLERLDGFVGKLLSVNP
ncbi:MAG: SRPBCC domain-containing protein [Trueperaceae bacterium]